MATRLQQLAKQVSPLSIFHGPSEPELIHETLGQHLAKNAANHGDRKAVISHWQDRSLTYLELHEASTRLARGLAHFDIRHGDRVAICAGNCIEYVILLYAVSKLGAILVALNPGYTSRELLSSLETVKVKMLCICPALAGRSFDAHFRAVEKAMPHVKIMTVAGGEFSGSSTRTSFEQATRHGSEGIAGLADIGCSTNDIVNIQFTSGTTGRPKAACLTHRNLLNNALFIASRMELTKNDVLCIPVPLFHCFGMVLGTLAAMAAGACAIYPAETFEPLATLESVARYRCTALHGVPTMFLRMLEILKQRDLDTSSLRTGIAAGTVVTSALMARITNELRLPELTITYGMTETSPASTMSSVQDPLQLRTETVGRVMPHTTIKIVDEQGSIVPIGQAGQVYTAGYLLQKGYWNDPQASNACLSIDENGTPFMKTGDRGYMDNEGYLRISGRVKDLIIRGGENINPSEIENLLVSHSQVCDSSVVGIHDELYGEVVGVFIEPRDPLAKPDLHSIQQHCRERGLAHYKIPAHVFLMGTEGLPETFPKTMSGKIQKYILRALGDKVISARKTA